MNYCDELCLGKLLIKWFLVHCTFNSKTYKNMFLTHSRERPATCDTSKGGTWLMSTQHSRKESLITQTNGSFARRSQQPCFWTTVFLFRPDSSKPAAISLNQYQQHHFLSPQMHRSNLWPRFPSRFAGQSLLWLDWMDLAALLLLTPS